MGTILDYLNKIKDLYANIKAVFPPSDDLTYYIDESVKSYEEMFNRFCPYKIGDRVELSQTPEISDEVAWGWRGCKHFLVEGSAGIVKSADFRNGRFCFYIEFDNESWIDTNGEVRPVDRKSLFNFSERYLRNENKHDGSTI